MKNFFGKVLIIVFGAMTTFLLLVALGYVFQRSTALDQSSLPLLPEVIDPSPTAPTVTIEPLRIETFFNNQLDLPLGISRDQVDEVLVTGDVLTARSVNTRTLRYNDFNWAWLQTADVLRAADITIINLETPLVAGCPPRDDGMLFCGDPRHIGGLQFAGVDIVNFANNHAGNWDQEGVDQTVEFVEGGGMQIVGIIDQGPVYQTIGETRYAFLSYNEVDQQVGINLAEEMLIEGEIQEAKESADVVIVQFHWGNEYTYEPSTNQRRWAEFAIDQGADLVVGNHPHWYQSIELYQGKAIMYSHGNFIFDQMWSRETREGVVGRYYFYEGKLVDAEFLPVLIEDYGQPRWLEGEERESVLENLEEISL